MIFFDKKHLAELMEAFYTLSGIKVGLHYTNGQEFLTYPDAELSFFCGVARTNPEINKKCRECDLLYMEECNKMNAPLVYSCHLGLTEVIVPIKENNVIISYFMFGQFIIDEFKEQSRILIYESTKEAGFENAILQNAIGKIKCVTSAKLRAMVKILEAITSQIIFTKMFDYSGIKFLDNLNLFIDTHISDNILIRDIYTNLQVSRSFLYMYSRKYIDCGISEYILNRKLNYAKNLLKNSNIKIQELPQKIGFSDYNYFARVFRKKVGVSPRTYRQGKDNQALSDTMFVQDVYSDSQ